MRKYARNIWLHSENSKVAHTGKAISRLKPEELNMYNICTRIMNNASAEVTTFDIFMCIVHNYLYSRMYICAHVYMYVVPYGAANSVISSPCRVCNIS